MIALVWPLLLLKLLLKLIGTIQLTANLYMLFEMKIERSLSDSWLSNTYLVYDHTGGSGLLIDAGGPVKPLLDLVESEQLKLEKVILTHRHFDHVAELDQVLERFPDVAVLAHQLEAEAVMGVTENLNPGDRVEVGELTVEAIHTPGHTAGMLSLLINGTALFTGDTLFKGSVGGVRAPGHTTYADIKDSIMQKLMQLPAETVIYPGHTDSSTVEDEWQSNPFIRIWRGLDPEGAGSCSVNGEQATLVLLAEDYDGGHKAWVRWPDGSDDIVPGSSVTTG